MDPEIDGNHLERNDEDEDGDKDQEQQFQMKFL